MVEHPVSAPKLWMSTDQINCVGAPQNGFPAFAKMFPASEKDEADGGVDYGRRSHKEWED